MAEKTGISWATHTWNPWYGCTKVSPGCAKCYMFRERERYGGAVNGEVIRSKTKFTDPLKWQRNHPEMAGDFIFTCSWSDFFHEEADEWRSEAWDVIRKTPEFCYLILTKRPERMLNHLPLDFHDKPWNNVWLGVSVERQMEADQRIPLLMDTPASKRFVSYEPALGQLTLAPSWSVDWLICGGESDDINPRRMDLSWATSIKDQCAEMGIDFWFKQMGGNVKSKGGNRLLGKRYEARPDFVVPKRLEQVSMF